MRSYSLVLPLLVSLGCTGLVARPPAGMTIAIGGAARAGARLGGPPGAAVGAQVEVSASVPVPPAPSAPSAPATPPGPPVTPPSPVPDEPPGPPPPPVAIVGAPVVEFFGIPLDGAQDVVFVLDCSGSMRDPAGGALAAVSVPAPAAPPGPDAAPAGPPPGPDAAPPGLDPAPPGPTSPGPTTAVVALATTKFDIARSELLDALGRLPDGTRVGVIFFNDDLDAVTPGLVTLDAPSRASLAAFVLGRQADGRTALTPAMRVALLMNPRRVVLLSDGLGNVGGSAGALLRDAREAVRGGTRIDTVGLGDDQDGPLLGELAAESGGLYQAL